MDTNDYIREDVASIRRLASGDPDARQIYDKLADDRLVRHAANAMQEKLQLARVKGRGGWWNSDECTIEHLRTLLREHVEKGDMRDVLNLAAMVYVREIADMRPNYRSSDQAIADAMRAVIAAIVERCDVEYWDIVDDVRRERSWNLSNALARTACGIPARREEQED